MTVTLRQRLGRTPIGRWLRHRREWRAVAHWSPKDEAVAGVYAAFVGPGSLCFDVGANMSHRTKVLRRLGARANVLRALDVLGTDHRAMGDVYIRFRRVRAGAAR